MIRLRSEIRRLFRSFGVPGEVASAYLRETAEVVSILAHRLADPERELLDRLEERCRAYWLRVMEADR